MNNQYDSIKMKIYLFFLSFILTVIIILLYCSDTSLSWNEKIGSCLLLSYLALHTIPSYRYCIKKMNSLSFEEGFRIGYILQFSGMILIPILGSPYFAIKYILNK